MRSTAKVSLVIGLLFVFQLSCNATAHAGTIQARSPAYSDVNSAVTSAGAGDTVIVPAGSATWRSSLVITKGINLQGAGSSATKISSEISSGYLIVYQPSAPANNTPFRLTGMHFDCNNTGWLNLKNTGQTPQKNIRVDHNTLIDFKSGGLLVQGPMWGVVDSNSFTGSVHFDNYNQNSCSDWSSHDYEFGDADNLYYEDNYFHTNNVAATNGHGGRYVYRYNTFVWTNPSGGLYPWFDMHGNQTKVPSGSRGGEIYGNVISGTITGLKAFDIRGGKSLIFFNKAKNRTTPTAYAREEYNDTLFCNPPGYKMHVNDSYFWNNRGSNGSYIRFSDSANHDGVAHPIRENQDYWQQNPEYNGTTQRGMYCGPQLPQTCTVGDGAWITTQNISDVDDAQLGANAAKPISGTLYVCTAKDTWSMRYKPFPYPHPLRGAPGQGTQELSAPTNLKLVDAAQPQTQSID